MYIDDQIEKLWLLLQRATGCNEGDTVFIESIDMPDDVLEAFVAYCIQDGITPFLSVKNQSILAKLNQKYSKKEFSILADNELNLMKACKGFIGLRAPENIFELSDLKTSQRQNLLKHFIEPVHYQYRNNHLNWIYFRWPTKAFAQLAEMNFSSFEKMYWQAVLMDYDKLEELAAPLKSILEKTENIHIKAPGTDIRFSIKNIGVYTSAGKHNLPDGEIHTAPVIASVEGIICFNVPSAYYGKKFENIELQYEQGRLARYQTESKAQQALTGILNTDAGAKVFGEFAIGFNPFIEKPINDILFDEKMFGSIHFALGNAYAVSDNGNRSGVHWDLILDLKKDSGGGAVYFDEEEIMKDGDFTHRDLKSLTRENIIQQTKWK